LDAAHPRRSGALATTHRERLERWPSATGSSTRISTPRGLTPQFSTYTDEDERYMATARRLDVATGAVDPAAR
jgi:hypothetical protein